MCAAGGPGGRTELEAAVNPTMTRPRTTERAFSCGYVCNLVHMASQRMPHTSVLRQTEAKRETNGQGPTETGALSEYFFVGHVASLTILLPHAGQTQADSRTQRDTQSHKRARRLEFISCMDTEEVHGVRVFQIRRFWIGVLKCVFSRN